VPERSLPVSIPSATTPFAVAWKLVIFALIESVDFVAAPADAGRANATAAASAASMMVWGFMAVRTRQQDAATSRDDPALCAVLCTRMCTEPPISGPHRGTLQVPVLAGACGFCPLSRGLADATVRRVMAPVKACLATA